MGIEDETTDEVDIEVVKVPVERSEVGGVVVEVTPTSTSSCARYQRSGH